MFERNRETVRQLRIMRALEYARQGVSLEHLASEHGVTTRTIRRDLEALEEIGVTVERYTVEGKARWKMRKEPFEPLAERGLSLTELCALYTSRALLECTAGSPFQVDLACAFEKIEEALTPKMRTFLDGLPQVVAAKGQPGKRNTRTTHDVIGHLLQASLEHKRARMVYHSFSSRKQKSYVIEPYRVIYAQGGVYFAAYVPDYGQMRTFAVERVIRLTLTEETFTPDASLDDEAFPNSLGVNVGEAVDIDLEFAPRIAQYVQERTYHRSQKTRMRKDGTLSMHLKVCNDWALRSWILGFGPFVRVVSPPALTQQILDELNEARNRYVAGFEGPSGQGPGTWPEQRVLPFSGSKRARPA